MVRRDPQTGKFVSSDERGTVDRHTTFTGFFSASLPAADLSGGVENAKFDGDSAVIVDFTEYLDSDEVFVAHNVEFHAHLGLPTTATAEGSAWIGFRLVADVADSADAGIAIPSDPYGRGATTTRNDFNIRQVENNDNSDLYVGSLYSENSLNDTANSVAAGAEAMSIDKSLDFTDDHVEAPAFDTDDELSVPTTMSIQNVSDHAVAVTYTVTLQGAVIEV